MESLGKKRLITIVGNCILLCVVALIFIKVYGSNLPSEKYYSDEGDYMSAVSKGFLSNYLDKHSMSLFSFVSYGFKYGLSKENATTLSNIARASGGEDQFRHYHGPVFIYYLIIGKNFIDNSETAFRWLSAFVLLACAIFVFMLLLLLNEPPTARVGCYLAAIMILFSPVLFDTVAFISPHMIYSLFTAVVLLLTAVIIKEKKLTYWYGALLCLALSTITIEYSPLLIVTFVISIYLNRKQLFPGWDKKEIVLFIAKSVLFYFLVIFIVWPAGIVKLSLIKSYIMYVYAATIRSEYYGTQNYLTVWLYRFKLSPVELTIIFLSIGSAVFMLKRRKWIFPFVLYCLLILLATIRNKSPASSHVSSFVTTGIILSGIIINNALSTKKITKFSAIFCIIALNYASFVYLFLPPYHRRYDLLYNQLNGMVEYVNKHYNERILVHRECLMTLHYYFPEKKIDSFREAREIGGFIQKGGEYSRVIYWGADKCGVLEKMKMKYASYEKDDVLYFNLINSE